MATKEEKKNKRIGWAVSIGIHTVLVLLLFFIMAWKEPNPPNPEYGIELNIGIEQQQGFGTQQPQPAQEEEIIEETQPETEVQEEVEETISEETVEETAEPTQEPLQEVGPDVIEEEPKPDVKPELEKEPEPREETKPEPTKEEPKKELDPRAQFPGNKSGQTKGETESTSQGDQRDKKGDRGSEEGNEDANALSGNPGGGDRGVDYDVPNWKWKKEQVNWDDTDQRGRIVFEITVDEYGEVISYKDVYSTVSSRSVIIFYANQLKDFTFEPSNTGGKTPVQTKGKFTFIIKSN